MSGPPPFPPFHTPDPQVGGSGDNNDNTNNHDDSENDSSNLQAMILSQMASLTELIKEHNAKGGRVVQPIRLDFGDENDKDKGKEKMTEADEELKKPFKEVLRSPFTRRIVEFTGENYVMPLNMKFYDGSSDPNDHLTRFTGAANQGQWPMPTWCLMFQQTLDGAAGGWFERLEPGSIDNWNSLRGNFQLGFHYERNVLETPRKSPRLSGGHMSRYQTSKNGGQTKQAISVGFQRSCVFRPSSVHTSVQLSLRSSQIGCHER